MKNILLGALIATTILLSINAATAPAPAFAPMPAHPKKYYVQYGSGYILEGHILNYLKQGYVVDKISFGDSWGMVVMYKHY